MRSFRLQIAVLSILCSGLVLTVFGASVWGLIHQRGMRKIDQDVRDWGNRLLPLLTGGPRGMHEQGVRQMLGEEMSRETILWARVRSGDTLYRSANWPEGLAVNFGSQVGASTGAVPADAPPLAGPGWGERRGPMLPGGGAFGEGPPGPPGPPDFPPPPWRPDGFEGRPPPPMRPPRGFGAPPQHRWIAPPRTFAAGTQRWRVGVATNSMVALAIGVDLRTFRAEMAGVRNAFLIAPPIALLLIALGAVFLAQRALRPVLAITATAEQITAKALDQRIPEGQEASEFQRLITVFNKMLDRLERSFGQAVRFSADAAHELKTPITILQGRLEQAVQAARNGSPEQRLFNELLEETHRLKVIIERLLLLARADAGTLTLHLDAVNLSETLESLCEDARIMAPNLRVEAEIEPDVTVAADAALLRQALHNLVSNAIKYNQAGGRMRFLLRDEGATVRFALSTTGAPIAGADRQRVFDRFFRADPSRSRRVDGLGLGLSLAREIAWAHKGDLFLDDGVDGLITFVLILRKEA